MLLLLPLLAGCLWRSPAYYTPAWSPDGQKLYYVAARPDGTLSVRRVDLLNKEAGELAAGSFPEPPVAMALSPKGDRLACAVLVRRNGRPQSLRLHVLSQGGAGDRVAWQSPTVEGVVDLCWMPDGQAVMVAADRPGGPGLWLAPANGGTPRPLAADLTEVRLPAVSPDGAQAAILARPNPKGLWSLHVLSLDTGRHRVAAPALFRTCRVGYGPAWSPDGRSLAYVAERYAAEGSAEIWLWDAAKGQRRALARTLAGTCFAPAWSPKGSLLAFVRLPFGCGTAGPAAPGCGDRPAEIVVVDAREGRQRPLVADGLANLMPAWSPDGATLAFTSAADPESGQHVVRLVDIESGRIRLAEESPGARFTLAMAHHARGSPTGLREALEQLAQIADSPARAIAHRQIAEVYAGLGQWRLVADHAREAAKAEGPPGERARKLLVEAEMRLGKPGAALQTASALAAEPKDSEAQKLAARLRSGLEDADRLRKQLAAKPTPRLLHQLADVTRSGLGNPRGALGLYFGLLDQHPDYPRAAEVAAALFDCYAHLRAHRASYRLLARMADLVGDGALTADHMLLLADAAIAGGKPDAARAWLDRLPREADAARAAELWCRLAESEVARAMPDAARAAWTHAAQAEGPIGAEASVAVARLLAQAGAHQEAARLVLAGFRPEATVPTMRAAMQLLARAQLQRTDPVAYGVARIGQLVAFAYYESAAKAGEQLLTGLPANDRQRATLRRHLAAAFDHLATYHIASADVTDAYEVTRRWLRSAAADDDLPRALATLAACHALRGDRRALVDTLTRLTLEFPDRAEGVAARRQLLLLDAPDRR